MTAVICSIRISIAYACGVLYTQFSWLGSLIIILILCMFLNCLTSCFVAGTHSKKFAGVGIIVAVFVSILLDSASHLIVKKLFQKESYNGYTGVIAPMVTSRYIILKIRKIMKNISKMGAPIPKCIQNELDALDGQLTDFEDIPRISNRKTISNQV